jgi:hypothetical protein
MMDLIARLILRLAMLFEPPTQRALRPVPVPVRNPPRPDAPR